MSDLEERLKKASSAVYIAMHEEVAKDISGLMRESIGQLTALREERNRYKEALEQIAKSFYNDPPFDKQPEYMSRMALQALENLDSGD